MSAPNNTHRFAFSSLLLLGSLLAFPPTFAQDWKGRGRLQGEITSETGEPVAGAKITLTAVDGTGGPEPLATDEKGKWSYLGLVGGNWNMLIAAKGFIPSEGIVYVNEYRPVAPVKIQLRPIPEGALLDQKAAAAVERLKKGNELLLAGDFAGSRAEYEAALPDVPTANQPMVLLEIARTHYQEGHEPEAIRSLERALALDPENADVLKLITHLLLNAGREEEAKVYMAKLPEGTKLDANTLLNVGIKHYNAQELDAALEEFNRVAEQYPDLAEVYYYRGLTYLNQGKNEPAAADFNKLLEMAPEGDKATEARQFLEYLAAPK
ncbi:MAG: tetratricopeptide repeat protein [Thermoanaerobaculia bacterium]|nr:tetratricopeptide repeat protein [Thermoanaerobaculia bacterium]